MRRTHERARDGPPRAVSPSRTRSTSRALARIRSGACWTSLVSFLGSSSTTTRQRPSPTAGRSRRRRRSTGRMRSCTRATWSPFTKRSRTALSRLSWSLDEDLRGLGVTRTDGQRIGRCDRHLRRRPHRTPRVDRRSPLTRGRAPCGIGRAHMGSPSGCNPPTGPTAAAA